MRAADWFADQDLVLRAQHLDRAEDQAAPTAYLEAARGQASVYHYERALGLVERGIEIVREDSDRFALACLHGELLHDAGSVDESMTAYRHAIEIAGDDVARCRAWIGLAAGMRIIDQYDDALSLLDDAETVASGNGLSLELSRIHHLRGNLYFPLGRIDDCLREHELSLDFADQDESPEAKARALGGLGDAYYALGRMITAHDYYSRCIAFAREHGFGRIEVANLNMLAVTRRYQNEHKESLEDNFAAIQAANRVGHQRAELVARNSVLETLIDLGEIGALSERIDRSMELVRSLGAQRFEPEILYSKAVILLTEDRHAEAEKLLEKCLEICCKTGIKYTGPFYLGKIAELTTDRDRRVSALEEGERLLRDGAVSHNYFGFYGCAMEACLNTCNWEEMERYAAALEDYTRSEPLPWSDFFIARARVLAAHGRGKRDNTTIQQLKRLRDEAERIGLKPALSALDEALAAS